MPKNPVPARDVPDIPDTELESSYFIQYQPEVAEKLSQHQSTYSVSGRCLSIVFSRMLYWSRYSKHRFQEKLWYWKNQTELSQETGFSIKQINRALKVLVELGLIIREKFHKHYYRQVYFYHIPTSPFTKQIKAPTGSRNLRTTNRDVSRGPLGASSQRFHGGKAATGTDTGSQEASKPSRDVPVSGPEVPGTLAPQALPPSRPVLPLPPRGARKINAAQGFGRKQTKCPIQDTRTSTSIKQSLKTIVDRCNLIGKVGLENITE